MLHGTDACRACSLQIQTEYSTERRFEVLMRDVNNVKEGKEIVPKADGEELTGQDLISSFLGDNAGDEDDAEEAEAAMEAS